MDTASHKDTPLIEAESYGALLGFLIVLAELPGKIEETLINSLPYLTEEELDSVKNALEARVVALSGVKDTAYLYEEMTLVDERFKNYYEELAILNGEKNGGE